MTESTELTEESAAVEMRGARGNWRVLGWLPWAVIAVYGVLALALWAEAGWRPEWDSAIYLLTARSLAAGEGYRYLGEAFFLRPPGLSWLLSFFASGDFDFALLNRLFMLMATAAVAAIYAAFRGEYGRGKALAIALLTGTSPLFVDQLNFILSEMPFVALLFSALTLLERGAREGLKSHTVAGVLLLALATYVRTVALVALPMVVWSTFRHRNQRAWLASLLPIAAILALVAPWFVFARSAARVALRPTEQVYLFDYTTALLRRFPGDPNSPFLTFGEWMERIGQNTVDVASGFTQGMFGTEHPAAILSLVALLAIGLLARVRRGVSLLDGFALAYSAVLFSYFTYSSRLLLPLLPIVYAYLAAAFVSLSRQAAPRGDRGSWIARGVSAATLAAVLAVAIHNVSVFPERLDARSRLPDTADRWEDLENASVWIRENTPEDAAILAITAPVVSLLSHRSVYTDRYTRRANIIERMEIDYAIAFRWTPRAARKAMAERSVASWELKSAKPGKWTHIYRIGSGVAPVAPYPLSGSGRR